MATVTTSTATNAQTNAFGYPPGSMMDLNIVTGELWMVFQDATSRAAIYKSSNNGASWTFMQNFNVSPWTLLDIQEMRIDAAGRDMHLVLFVSESGSDALHYKRIDISTGTPGTSGTLRFSGPAGSGQSLIYSGACCPVVNPDGSTHIFLAAYQHGTTSGVRVYVVTVRGDDARTTFSNDAVIGPTRQWRQTGDDTAGVCSIDVEHNGDGITSSHPNMWVTWMFLTTIYCIRCTWKGYKSGWGTPSSAAVVATGRTNERDCNGRWDGSRFIIANPNPANLQQVQIFERNATNTGNTATRTSPSNGFGTTVVGRGLSYNYVTKDIRLIIPLNASVYWVDYIRATNTWSAWTATGWADPLGGSKSEFGIRRGTWGTAQYDVYLESGAGSPWTITSQTLAVNFAPTAPTWVIGVAGTVETNGGAFDVAAPLLLDWTFNDPNVTDTQQSFALSRQIGGGTIQWWRTSDSTWQVVETWNTSSTTSLTLAAANWVGGGGAGDPAHVYKVATKDSGGSIASPYSLGLSIVPSTRVDPTLTAPTVNQIEATGTVPVTWTVTEQGAWRVKVQPTIVADAFGRTASNTWGDADYGGTYGLTGGAGTEFDVTGGVGRMKVTSIGDREAKLPGVFVGDVNVLIGPLSVNAAPLTAAVEQDVIVRYQDSSNWVRIQLFYLPAGGCTIHLVSTNGGVDTSTGFITVPAVSNTGPVSIRFVVVGTQIMAKAWAAGNPEPTAWLATLTAPTTLPDGPIALRAGRNTGNTNGSPFTFNFDGLIISHASLITYDSGWQTDPLPLTPSVLSLTPPKLLPDGYAGVLRLQTRNAEGLLSVERANPFTVDFVEPVAPTLAVTSTPAAGGLTVTPAQAAAVGTQPVTTQIDLYRRKVIPGTVNGVNANPFFETNANDWTSSGYSTIARSTAQFHTGAASLLCTPNGATAAPKAQTTALYPIVVGSRYEFRGWIRSATANKVMRVYIDWYDNVPTLLSSTVKDLTPAAGGWVYFYVRGAAPLGATQIRGAIGQLATPAAGDLLYGDELELMVANDDDGIAVFREITLGTGYLDWRTVTGTDYEYRALAYASDGTHTAGPWTD